MVETNAVLMKMARESLKGNWGSIIGIYLVYFIIVGLIQVVPWIGPIASLIITGPLSLGFAMLNLSISRDQGFKLEMIFKGFDNFVKALEAYLIMLVFVLLWMLLLIIPGIIAALSYSMTFYILADDNSISGSDAIERSKKMMDGYKWKYFCLGLRFFGWAMLCILTLGIGFLWLAPYIGVSNAKFYEDLKRITAANEI